MIIEKLEQEVVKELPMLFETTMQSLGMRISSGMPSADNERYSLKKAKKEEYDYACGGFYLEGWILFKHAEEKSYPILETYRFFSWGAPQNNRQNYPTKSERKTSLYEEDLLARSLFERIKFFLKN